MVKEVTNKAFRNRMNKESLSDIHLYKNTLGYFYISSDKRNFRMDTIYINSFNQQGIDGWIEDIKSLIRDNED